ncbi:exopolysaccharide biosynthesis polyprenyl glycosylphosphotransferase [Novipirellula sp. SH528]|uniref:exopolysaccharide biosynthesis polyprenyl glycosylphosphotransferase n=1 Tax=Novipirellula sp. SH528 TaxID=3454466 RepID=UPI003F9F8F58
MEPVYSNPYNVFTTATVFDSSVATSDTLVVDESSLESRPSVDQIIELHTGVRPSRRLSLDYTTQSLLTATPLLMVDLAVSVIGLLLSSYVVNHLTGHLLPIEIWKQVPALLVLQSILLLLHQMYPGVGVGHVFELRGLLRSTFFSFVILASLNAWLGQLPKLEFATFVVATMAISLLMPIARFAARYLLGRTRWWGLRVLVLGDRLSALQTCEELTQHRSWGFRPIGYGCEQDDESEKWGPDELYIGPITNGVETAISNHAPVIVVASGERDHSWAIERLAFQCPAVVSFRSLKSPLMSNNAFQSPCTFATHFNSPLLRFAPRALKRISDLAICIPTLILLSPVALLIAFLIRRSDGGPVFFGHKRIGQHGQDFRAWKFRSMVENAEQVLEQYLLEHPELRAEWEKDQKLRDDPRIIKGVGHFLRKWSIDEFPQMWNVLWGEMSLVGPRPIVESEIAKYSEGYYAYSHMLPGLTGLWQVSGRNDTTYAERVALDCFYAKNWTPWLDLLILVKTPVAVFGSRGAY